MATGYTSALCESEQSFKDFVLKCACAFFYDLSTLPKRWSVDPRYKADNTTRARLNLVMKMSDAEAEQLAAEEYEKKEFEWRMEQREKAKMLKRLTAMRVKVGDWAPPTPGHDALKQFMIQQLDETIHFEARGDRPRPARKTGVQWRRDKLAELRHNIEFSDKMYAEETDRVNQRNAWCDALRKSLARKKVKAGR